VYFYDQDSFRHGSAVSSVDKRHLNHNNCVVMIQNDLASTIIDDVLNDISAASVQYCDVRVTYEFLQRFTGSGDQADIQSEKRKYSGFGVRVLKNGAWGYAASSLVSSREARRMVRAAVELAGASSTLIKQPVVFGKRKAIQAQWAPSIRIDPFSVSDQEKTAMLLNVMKIAQQVKGVGNVSGSLAFHRTGTWFGSTEGSRIFQQITMPSIGLVISAGEGRDSQSRSWPSSHGGFACTGGLEGLERVIVASDIVKAAEEAVMLVHAPPCPLGVFPVILAPDQMSLQIHESIGHPLELDRVFGVEANFSGTSFAQPHLLNRLQFGSEQISVVTDPTEEGVLAAYGYDDDGVPARPVPLIQNGVLVGYLSGRETAGRLNLASSGNNRAAGWQHFPINRMSNTRLEPGRFSWDDLLAGIEWGLFMETNRSWTIDDRRETFRFECEIAREISSGKLGKIYRNPVYSGRTLDFWRSCDALGDASLYRNWGTAACGKGEPAQTLHTSQGSPPARFKSVSVSSARPEGGRPHA
jgi:TldD protein